MAVIVIPSPEWGQNPIPWQYSFIELDACPHQMHTQHPY